MGKEQTPPPPPPPSSTGEKSKSNRTSGHSSSAKPPSTKPVPASSAHSRPPVSTIAAAENKNKHSGRPTPSTYHQQQQPKKYEKKAAMSIRITKNGQQKGQSPARGGSKVGTCSKTGLFLVTASMPDVGIVPPPSDERSPQFCCVWPVTETERDCGGLVVEDTSINGVACQVLKNSGGKEDRELSACLLLPLST
ncbi:hypothetical protein TYRP_010088 [Tyrophagus putrescentiae]|nr:hypothetical protein TYRP_010088 [Tyrophagus putrescentiae]